MRLPGHARHRRLPLLLGLLAVAVVFWLRWPTMGFRHWSVDEAIHTAIARVLNDGGVLYRDAIDQRTPLSYYSVALLYRVFGEGNIWALHAFTALLIGATACLLGACGRAMRRPGLGVWAAVLYAVLTTGMLWHGDAFAFNTEWMVALFTTAAAAVMLKSGSAPGRGALVGAGALIGLAFLSKQPALLDLAAPAVFLAYLAWQHPDTRSQLPGRWLLLAAGFVGPILFSVLYFASQGALDDYVFAAWTYNLQYYGPEVSLDDRISTFWRPFRLLVNAYPLIAIVTVAGLGYIFYRLVQRTPTADESRDHPGLLYIATWTASSMLAAASSGRTFEHYYIQCLPALCLAAGWALHALTGSLRAKQAHRGWRLAAGAFLMVLIASATHATLGARQRKQSVDPSLRSAEFVRDHSLPDESIFVWGYHPDAYVFADRKPGSRYVYGSFVTGLIPWTNAAPELDTRYAIVPGAMDKLLQDLEASRPTFIIDSSEGRNRFWNKYPFVKFPELRDFVQEHYLMVEPEQFLHQGFGVYLIRDGFRSAPLALSGGDIPGGLEEPLLMGPASTDAKPTNFALLGRSRTGRLQRLELLHNGEPIVSVSFLPTDRMTVRIPVPFDRLGVGEHRLSARATDANGVTLVSGEQIITVDATRLAPEQLAAFALPHLARAIAPTSVRAAFGANVEENEGSLVFYAHAPSTLTYPLQPGARHVRGQFAIRPGAYASDNPHPSDGAEFQVNLLRPDGSREILFSRLLRPGQIPEERGLQGLSIPLPADAAGQLEFIILPGPAGNPSSDWTYWSGLLVETSG